MIRARYFAALRGLLDQLETGQGEAIARAGTLVGESLVTGGVVHVFGSGHSHMLAEEVFCRAGGLVPVDAMLDPNLTFFGTVDPDVLERTEGYAAVLLGSYDVRAGEVVIVASNSGVNPVPIELAVEARRLGCVVVAVTSARAYEDAGSRHSEGLRLVDVADVVIDTGVPAGDAVVTLEDDESGVRLGAGSTVLGAATLNAVMLEAAACMAAAGVTPPVLASMNVAGGDEWNERLAARYRHRLPHLRV